MTAIRARLAASPAAHMVLASFLFATMGVCVKLASGAGYSTGEIVFCRGLIGAVLMAALARAQRVPLATPVPYTHFWRSLTGVIALAMWFYAIGQLPLATAMTLNYMSSVWLALFLIGGAAIVGAARVDGRLVGTVLIGFAGVALILRPTIAHDQLWHGLIGLLSGVISALAYAQVAALARSGEPELRIVFYFSLGGAVLGLALMVAFGTQALEWRGALLMFAVGALATTAQWLMTRAYSTGRMLVIASLQYLGIAYAFGYGMLLFGERLTWSAAGGIVLIVGAGIGATRLRSERETSTPVANASMFEP